MKKISWLAIGLCLAMALSSFIYARQICPRTAYVDMNKVYHEFELKREYEQQLHGLNQDTQFMLDSLQNKIEQTFEQYQKNNDANSWKEIEKMQLEYQLKQQRIDEDKEQLVEQYESNIWKQLSQFVRDYSEKEGYDYLLGTAGDGTIMGGKAEYDVTEAIVEYVNHRYHGGDQ